MPLSNKLQISKQYPGLVALAKHFLRSLIKALISGAVIRKAIDISNEIVKEKPIELSGASKSIPFEEFLADFKKPAAKMFLKSIQSYRFL